MCSREYKQVTKENISLEERQDKAKEQARQRLREGLSAPLCDQLPFQHHGAWQGKLEGWGVLEEVNLKAL